MWRKDLLLHATVAVATSATIVGIVTVALITPAWMHYALTESGSHRQLLIAREAAEALSDEVIADLMNPRASFDAVLPGSGPLSDREQQHLGDVRLVLLAVLSLGLAGLIFISVKLWRGSHPLALWRGIRSGGALTSVVLLATGAFAFLSFETAFTAFHGAFFPQGNYVFDPRSQWLVRLYPGRFWQLTGAVWIGVVATTSLMVSGLGWWKVRSHRGPPAGGPRQHT